MTEIEGRVVTEKFAAQLKEFDVNLGRVFRNLPHGQLVKDIIKSGDGRLTDRGAVAVKSGKYSGRVPDDRFIVKDDATRDKVDWGPINHPTSPEIFGKLLEKMKRRMDGKDAYVFDGFVGADTKHHLPIRVFNDRAWQNLFSSRLFIRPTEKELEEHEPEFTLLCMTDFVANPQEDGTRSDVFIMIDLTRKVVLISGIGYAGEVKKSMFSVMNFLLPDRGVFPMHCSANTDAEGHTALFFGLSGTGKTTLSADDSRWLIGDDEHGWSDTGVFNFEGGCYAKCINLTHEREPLIWNAIKDGALLENVVVDRDGVPDYADNSLSENARTAYPIHHIPGAVSPSVGGHPSVVIFLTADAKGVLPPISKLDSNGAMYHFMSGYTSKLGGTEMGVKKPKSAFSECFGAPFMPRHAQTYAKMLAKKMKEHDTRIYLINTGWTGGPYGTGSRIELAYSRAMVKAALRGQLDDVEYQKDDIFNLNVPTSCPGVPDEVLDPHSTWEDKAAYDVHARRLAAKFQANFAKFGDVSPEIIDAGPRA